MLFGVLNLSLTGYLIAVLGVTQLTIASVTIYLHRNQSHRALTLHPIISHVFRFWLWLTTGMVTADWVAIHRKHHATTDREGDPHSPVVLGIKKVFWQGAELYRLARKNKDMIAQYSHGTPDDWLERHLYARHPSMGIGLLLLINLFFFGIPGLTIWAIQMLWIPLFAAGVINGLGHHWGYRNFECHDAATNIIPWGFWIGGEELHNNHHSFASSAKFSVRWWEFDIGWMYICILSFFGLAQVKKLPPKMARIDGKSIVDLDTVKAIVSNRFQVMTNYYKEVIKPLIKQEKKNHLRTKADKKLFQRAGQLLRRDDQLLCLKAKRKLHHLLAAREKLQLAYHYKLSLQNVWLKTASSQKELIESLQQWCRQAEESGLQGLKQFAQQLKGYVPVPAVII